MKIKNKEGKRLKSFSSIVYYTYKDFAENTSIHGLKYTVMEEIGTWEKLFWIMMVLIGLITSIYLTFLFGIRYVSNPTRTTILSYYAPTTAIQFPAISICNINRILDSKVDTFLGTLSLNESEIEIARIALPQVQSFSELIEQPQPNNNDLNILQNVLERNDIKNISFLMQNIAQNCSEMVKYCTWENSPVDCSEIFVDSLTVDGYCCSFNYGSSQKKKPYTEFSGLGTGLTVILDPMLQPVQYSTYKSSGFKNILMIIERYSIFSCQPNGTEYSHGNIMLQNILMPTKCYRIFSCQPNATEYSHANVIIHDPTEYPGFQSTTKIISKGRLSYLQLYGTKMICSEAVSYLPISQRDCYYPNELQLHSFKEYSYSNCFTECEAHYYYEKCECVPYFFEFIGKPQCNISKLPCTLDTRSGRLDLTTICDCPTQCEDDYYSVITEHSSFDYEESMTLITFGNTTITKDSTMLNVFFNEQTQTIYLRDTIFSTIYLLSSFGGVYSLFLGCSLITVVEIIYYCVFRFFVNMKLLGTADIEEKTKRPIPSVYNRNMERYFNSTFLP